MATSHTLSLQHRSRGDLAVLALSENARNPSEVRRIDFEQFKREVGMLHGKSLSSITSGALVRIQGKKPEPRAFRVSLSEMLQMRSKEIIIEASIAVITIIDEAKRDIPHVLVVLGSTAPYSQLDVRARLKSSAVDNEVGVFHRDDEYILVLNGKEFEPRITEVGFIQKMLRQPPADNRMIQAIQVSCNDQSYGLSLELGAQDLRGLILYRGGGAIATEFPSHFADDIDSKAEGMANAIAAVKTYVDEAMRPVVRPRGRTS